jgi:hypothetical protein
MELVDSINVEVLWICFKIALLGICLYWLVSNYSTLAISFVVNVNSLCLFSSLDVQLKILEISDMEAPNLVYRCEKEADPDMPICVAKWSR